ncbi:MAG: aspartate/glutamate racemase family protein, partial [Desulfobacterales bacterium]
MPKHIGIVGCSAEGAALCYRTICGEAPALMGEHMHPEVSMHTHPLADYMVHIRRGDWENVAALMLSSTHKLSRIGAQFAICPDNTIHEAFEIVRAQSPIPWLHIAEAVAVKAHAENYNQLGILGTKYLMMGPVYPDKLKEFNIAGHIPAENDREKIDKIIFKELVNAVFTEKSRIYFNEVIEKL